MAKSLTQLNIFLSGTTEVDSEKSAFRRVVEELNKQLEKTHGITLRVRSWPDDVRPGVNTDPQAELNRQIGDEYDIYIGLLGTRFGTPTPRAGSGTEEEFKRALSKFETNERAVRLLFYFKRSLEDPFSIDLESFQRVMRFRSDLTRLGVLYRDFKDNIDFVQQVKEHLYNLIIDEWNAGQWIPIDRPEQAHADQVAPTVEDSIESISQTLTENKASLLHMKTEISPENLISEAAIVDETDLGFLDYVDGFQQSVDALSETITNLTKHTKAVSERIIVRTAESEALTQELERQRHIGGNREAQLYVPRAKKVADDTAADLDEFVSAMAADLERYRTNSRAMLANFRGIIEYGADFTEVEDKSKKQSNLFDLINIMLLSRDRVNEFQESIRRTPALTGKFKRARNRAVSMLGEFVAEISFFIEEAKSILTQLGVDDNNITP